MKSFIILLIAFALYQQSFGWNSLNNPITRWPRKDLSCKDQATSPGYFWDGQKCEYCRSAYCYCSSYYGCDSCMEGSSMFMGVCIPCGNTQNDNLLSLNIKTCCFGQDQGNNSYWYMRATQCMAYGATNQNSLASNKLFGSVCLSVLNCVSLNTYGDCVSCQKGFYLDSGRKCSACDSNQLIMQCQKNDGTLDTVAYPNGCCAACNGRQGCTECQPGFFMQNLSIDTKELTDVTTTQTKSVSSCRRCKNPACTCSSTTNCLSCITDVKFFYSGGDCLACPLANCIKCKDAKTCDTCEENYGVNDVGACTVLLYCFKPVWSTDKKAMICDASNCYNGYFLNTDLKCAPCFTTSTETDVARAEGRCNTNTVASPVSLLTQCAQHEMAVSTNQQINNFNTLIASAHADAYYLVTVTDKDNKSTLTCVSNKEFLCRKMNAQGTGCETCYVEQGYIFNLKTTRCQKCQPDLQAECITCKYNGDAATGKVLCTQCRLGSKSGLVGYVLVGELCQKCDDNFCSKCSSSPSTCEECFYSYRILDTAGKKTCEPCTAITTQGATNNCLQCNANKDICELCQSGTRLIKVTDTTYDCEKCWDSKCQQCSQNANQCEKCSTGYYINNGQCNVKRNGCAIQRTDGIDGYCNACSYNYRNIDGWCYPCKGSGAIVCPFGCGGNTYSSDGDKVNRLLDQHANILLINIISLLFIMFLLFN